MADNSRWSKEYKEYYKKNIDCRGLLLKKDK